MTHATRDAGSTGVTYTAGPAENVPGALTPETVPYTMTANDTSPRWGHESNGRTETWRCRECGTLRAVDERPTECYHCRCGEHEYGERRLFERFDVIGGEAATDRGEPSG